MPASADNATHIIIELQRLKHEILKCSSKQALIERIDSVIELLYASIHHPYVSSTGMNMQAKVQQLKNIRSDSLQVNEEQLKEYCQDISILLGSTQFELWQGHKDELIALIQSASN